MRASMKLILVTLAVLSILLYSSLFVVKEGETAIRFRFGEVIQADYSAGLHFKMPIINTVKKYDARLQTLDTAPERFLTSEKKNLSVDSFVQWRLNDAKQFYTNVGGDIFIANQRLDQFLKDGLRNEFGKRTLNEVVTGDRDQIMSVLSSVVNEKARQIGVEVVDVRIKRIDLPEEVSESVFDRMRAERERVARDFRSRGKEAAERIKADADRQRTVMLAESYRDAETTRGEGDAKAAEVYANAYSKNTEFYRLYRSLNAYRNSFNSGDDILVLQPKDSEFFQYFNQLK